MSPNKLVATIDVGTSQVRVLIAEVIDRSINIVSLGQATTEGVRKGEIVDMRTAGGCVHAAITQAEKLGKVRIEDNVLLAVTGGHLDGFANTGTASVSDPENYVSEEDIRRAHENARSRALPPGRAYLHRIPCGWKLDGRECANPLQMQGQHLEVGYWHVHGESKKVANTLHLVNSFGLSVSDVVVSSVAAGYIVAHEMERKNGVLVLDIGCGTTDFALFRNGHVIRSGCVAVGGDHFTNDLSLGLRITHNDAEGLKLRAGNAAAEHREKSDVVLLKGDLAIGDRPLPRGSIEKILHARAVELFTIVQKKLGLAFNPTLIPGGVILTGGGSQLPGLCESAQHTLGLPVRLGQHPEWVVRHEEVMKPEFSTVLGLLYHFVRMQRRAAGKQSKAGGQGLLSRMGLGDIFK